MNKTFLVHVLLTVVFVLIACYIGSCLGSETLIANYQTALTIICTSVVLYKTKQWISEMRTSNKDENTSSDDN